VRRYFICADQLMIEGEKDQFKLIRDAKIVANTCEAEPEVRFADADLSLRSPRSSCRPRLNR
jgi:hypothetical protein